MYICIYAMHINANTYNDIANVHNHYTLGR